MVRVVKYKDKYYVWYKTHHSYKAQLIDENGKKFSGTPLPEKLEVVKVIQSKIFNNHEYFMTKIGCFSVSTGNKITNPDILKLFK